MQSPWPSLVAVAFLTLALLLVACGDPGVKDALKRQAKTGTQP